MNFLAHAYLSFDHPELLAGNMISDFVKGSARYSYSSGIQKGITLHRSIDEYTDRNPAVQKAKEFFRPSYRLYSGAIVDVLFDHYLATDETIFTDVSLKNFTLRTYSQLRNMFALLPPSFMRIFPYMVSENWLYNYRLKEGMKKSLGGLVRRAAYLYESETAYNLFIENYVQLNEIYKEFFSGLWEFSRQKKDELLYE